jgi:hypothetical protein
MTTLDAREAELLDRHKKELEESRAIWSVSDYLDLDKQFRVSICRIGKDHEPTLGRHFGVRISLRDKYPSGMSLRHALDILHPFISRDEILTVPRWKEPSYSPVWMPDECNYSRDKPGAERVGVAQIELSAHGTSQFCVTELAFWIRIPNNEDCVELSLAVDNLPSTWLHRPLYKGFDQQTGQSKGVTMSRPPGLPGTHVRLGMGSPDSWRADTYWETADEFVAQLLLTGNLP